MPGFLKVYAYYSPTLKKWNIDLSLSLHKLDIILTVLFSQLFYNFIFLYDDRNIPVFPDGRATEYKIWPKTWTLLCS